MRGGKGRKREGRKPLVFQFCGQKLLSANGGSFVFILYFFTCILCLYISISLPCVWVCVCVCVCVEGCRCLVATHYHRLGRGRQLGLSVGSYQLEAEVDKDGELVFTYRVKVTDPKREGGGEGETMRPLECASSSDVDLLLLW